MTKVNPCNQFCISLTLIVVGLFSFFLGLNAAFQGTTEIGIVDSLVGDGSAFATAGFIIAGLGVVWIVVLLVRRFLA